MAFVHLHTHTQYSILDASNKIDNYIERVKELGQTAAAITDHGNMYGCIEFYDKAKAAGIKPIIGCEVYVATGSRFEKNAGRSERKYYHLVLLCENQTGYQNLIKLVSISNMEGFYSKPRVDLEVLRKYHEGLIALSACIAGALSVAAQSSYEEAKKTALTYLDIFGENNYFLEMQDHMDGSQAQQKTNQTIMRLSEELGIPTVVTNDCHYTLPSDAQAHDVLLCMQENKTIDDPDRMRYEGGQYYVKSEEEMKQLFPYARDAVERTQEIADRCSVEFTYNQYHIPRYQLPEGYDTPKELLTSLCWKGFDEKYTKNDYYTDEDRKKIKADTQHELDVIEKMGFIEYILIVWDYINWANTHGCKTGPGRGSAAGSRVCYCIGITNVDPVRYNLLFERFLNPERVSMPDIDVDFEDAERGRVITDYIFPKYGQDYVSQITTFMNMNAKAVVKDVGRALGRPFAETNQITKLFPRDPKITIEQALAVSPELREFVNSSEDNRQWFKYAEALEGIPKSTGLHAAGVVIYPKRADECMPLGRSVDGIPACEYNMVQLEKLGYLKMDFLGLRTLTVIKDAVKNVRKSRGIDVDIDHIDLNDRETLDFISTGKTDGVFQLESEGMQNFMKDLHPDSFEDIIAGISLYRPGPMEFIPDYIKGKKDPGSIVYKCPQLEPILKDTYGCIVYQEQVMQIVQNLAGYSMGGADNIRRAMSKKKQHVIDEERQNFVYGNEEAGIPGCIRNGIDEKTANEIYDSMVDFAKYAFNKSHAASYAVLSMQTAYLKHYYPAEFFAALLTSVIDSSFKMEEYLAACREAGINVLPPDIQEGTGGFSVSGSNIRYGMYAIKGIGQAVIDPLIKERDDNGRFKSLSDFIERAANAGANKRAVENLIKAGALDSLPGNRRQKMYAYPGLMDQAIDNKKNSMSGQMSLFDLISDEDRQKLSDNLPNVDEFPKDELLAFEKEVLGIYISGHPLEDYVPLLKKNVTADSTQFMLGDAGGSEADDDGSDVPAIPDGKQVVIGGILTDKTVKLTRKNQQMAFVTLEDMNGTVEVIVFPALYDRYRHILNEDEKMLINGHASVEEGKDARLIADEIVLFSEVPQDVWLQFENRSAFEAAEKNIMQTLQSSGGNDELIIYLKDTRQIRKYGSRLRFSADSRTLDALKQLCGEDNVRTTAHRVPFKRI